MNIDWRLSNQSGIIISTNGKVTGSKGSIYLDVPQNIKIVMSVRQDYQPTITSAQANSLRNVIRGLPLGVKFSSKSTQLEEMAISIYHGNRS